MLTSSTLSDAAAPGFRFSITATFTADPLRPIIEFWGKQLHRPFEVRFAPYNQILQSLIDPRSELGRNTQGVNIVLARIQDLAQFDDNALDWRSRTDENVRRLIDELLAASSRFPVPLIFVLCPSASHPGGDGFEAQLRRHFTSAAQGSPNLHCLDFCDVQRLYPVTEVFDEKGEKLGNIPFTELYFSALGTTVVRYAHSLSRAPYKVVALDCDNTLWQGICGEDGPEGVVLDGPRKALHEFMLEQREAGTLLTLASKNNEQDVIDTFAAHPEMPLQMRHFVAWRLNWDSKSENLRQLSKQLSLGADSFIFIDDNPKECAELRSGLPSVLTLTLPEPIDSLPHFLAHVWAFDRPVVTEEDRKRNASYEQSRGFVEESSRAASLEDFMAKLELRVSVLPLTSDRLARAAQLTQRTNQFNFSTIRRNDADVSAFCREGGECFLVEAADRFGEYGMVGLLLLRSEASELTVDTFLLSCRALGRGVEHRMLAFVGQHALDKGLRSVVLPFVPSAKNRPARQFFDSIGAGERVSGSMGTLLRMAADEAARFVWQAPSEAATIAVDIGEPAPGALTSHVPVDYERIAHTLSTAEQILEQMRAAARTHVVTEGMSETEAKLAGIWAELLQRNHIARTDNFFDIGGHSLVAVLLLLRIREHFGVELKIDDVYTGTLTLAELAARIEAAQVADIDPEEYAALLAEIEGLSDEEARALLDQEPEGLR